ncbi:hypothetical protein COBT_001693 [Conglomerata obtusa]
MNSILYIVLYTVRYAKADADIIYLVNHINLYMNEIEMSKTLIYHKAKFYDFRSQYVKPIDYISSDDTYFEIKNCNTIFHRVIRIPNDSDFDIRRIQNNVLCPVLFYFTQAYKDYVIDWIIYEKLYVMGDTTNALNERELQKICFDLCQELKYIDNKDVNISSDFFKRIYGRRRKDKLSSGIFLDWEKKLQEHSGLNNEFKFINIANVIGNFYAQLGGTNSTINLDAKKIMSDKDSEEKLDTTVATSKDMAKDSGNNSNINPIHIGTIPKTSKQNNTNLKFNLKIALMKRYNRNTIVFELITLISAINDHIQKVEFFITEVDNDLIISFADIKARTIECMENIGIFLNEKVTSSYDFGCGGRFTINTIMPGMVVHEDILNKTITFDSIGGIIDDCEMVFAFRQFSKPTFLVENNNISTNSTGEHLDVSKQKLQDEKSRVLCLGLFALKYGCLTFRNEKLNIDSHDKIFEFLTQEKLKSYTKLSSKNFSEFILLCFGFNEKIVNPTLNDILDSEFMKYRA